MDVRIRHGEAAAIALTRQWRADLPLMDDCDGRSLARQQGLRATGVLGILRVAVEQETIDVEATTSRLRETDFRAPKSTLDVLIEDFRNQSA